MHILSLVDRVEMLHAVIDILGIKPASMSVLYIISVFILTSGLQASEPLHLS